MLLSADLWVSALQRRVEQAGSFFFVAKRGDARFGSVLIKVVNLRDREAYILREATQGDETVWMRPLETRNEPDLDTYIQRQIKYDGDLWVIEIEDVSGKHFLTEKVSEI